MAILWVAARLTPRPRQVANHFATLDDTQNPWNGQLS